MVFAALSVLLLLFQQVTSFQIVSFNTNRQTITSLALSTNNNDDNNQLQADKKTENTTVKKKQKVEEYNNIATRILSLFIDDKQERQPTAASDDNNIIATTSDPLSHIDWNCPKILSTTSIETLAQALDYELIEKEWFMTGNVNPSYFSDSFKFQDPDVKLSGIEDYARGVYKLFNQETSRAEIISTQVINATAISCTWRLSGDLNIAFGLPIKPYIVYSDFIVDPQTSLIVFQEDRFDLPAWDIFVSSLFPFTIGMITAPPAAEVPRREVTMPKIG